MGVQLEDGTEVRSDRVISAADRRTTIFDLLGGRYVDQHIQDVYSPDKTKRLQALKIQ